METKSKIRQPIVTIAGHVDHGKTSILDAIRGSSVVQAEAGGITQKISFTSFPSEALRKACPLIKKYDLNLEIPGFLFIDTPGHAAFTSLRKRGGSLSDLAVLVIDINEGIKPQTAEVLQIMKHNKTPFIIALNKIDKIRGWSRIEEEVKNNIERQPVHAKQEFDEKFYTIVGALNSYGFDSELFYRINDFTKKVALVPCSAKTKEGLAEILMVLCGLSQRFLKERITLGKTAKGIILEMKKEKNMNLIEAILYDGTLSVNDEIAIASFEKPILTKVKAIHEILPLSFKFKSVNCSSAASGIRMQISSKEGVLPGMPFMTYTNETEIAESFKQLGDSIKPDKKGIIIKADSLGSLEAIILMLKEHNIKFVKAGIGSINKSDILSAKANLEIDPIDALVAGFNVEVEEDAKSEGIKIIREDIIYKLIENLQKFREEKASEIEKERLMELANIAKLEILHQYIFRNTSPAIFGVRVAAGKIKSGMELIDGQGESIGRIKHIESEGKSVLEASSGMEVAISIPGANFERKLKDKKYLFSELSERQFKKFKDNKDLLSSDEISVLHDIKAIKQKKNGGCGN